MTTFSYKPSGVCSKLIEIDSDNNIIQAVRFTGGCSGNTQGVASLCVGLDAKEVVKRLSGIKCGAKQTSCPDQLAIAISKMLEGKA